MREPPMAEGLRCVERDLRRVFGIQAGLSAVHLRILRCMGVYRTSHAGACARRFVLLPCIRLALRYSTAVYPHATRSTDNPLASSAAAGATHTRLWHLRVRFRDIKTTSSPTRSGPRPARRGVQMCSHPCGPAQRRVWFFRRRYGFTIRFLLPLETVEGKTRSRARGPTNEGFGGRAPRARGTQAGGEAGRKAARTRAHATHNRA